MELIFTENWKLFHGDAEETLKKLDDNSVDCCVTSPPYYALRDYGVDGQIGLEDSPEAYIKRLVGVFHEVKRVLKPTGTCWVNIGDSYWGSGSRGFDFTDSFTEKSKIQMDSKGTVNLSNVPSLKGNVGDYKDKDLIGIPWMLAFALRDDGWYLRQDIVWAKPNPMPESVFDRFTRSHEYIFLMSKNQRYYFDHDAMQEDTGDADTSGYCKRNKRDVWRIASKPCPEAHFATFPLDLVETCLIAGCPVGGVVMDPFSGSGSTGIAAARNGRNYIGIELNPEYVEITKKRAKDEAACAVEVM